MDSAGLNFEFQDLADQISLTSSERLCEYLQSITDCSVRRVRVEELDSRLDCIDIEKLDLDSLCFNFPPNLNDSPLTFAWGLVMYVPHFITIQNFISSRFEGTNHWFFPIVNSMRTYQEFRHFFV